MYVISKDEILNRINELRNSFLNKYPKTRIAYAAKAFFPMAMANLLRDEDIGVDVVSGGELFTALKGGIHPKNIEFNGNNKTQTELKSAIDAQIGRIIVDNIEELESILKICEELNKPIELLFRITPGIKGNTHAYMETGSEDSKFGIPLSKENLDEIFKIVLSSKYLKFKGFHFHIGSQIIENSLYLKAVDVILGLCDFVQDNYGLLVEEINVGGGFGIIDSDQNRPSFSYFLDPLLNKIYQHFKNKELELPSVVIEPGRSIISDAGITLYTLGFRKEIKGIRTYIGIDGGMTDNIRPALYGAKYNAIIANKANDECDELVTIAGKCCESGDILIKDIKLPSPNYGDILAVLSTGAYCYTLSNRYNQTPRPPIIMVGDGKSSVIVEGETYEDLLIGQHSLSI